MGGDEVKRLFRDHLGDCLRTVACLTALEHRLVALVERGVIDPNDQPMLIAEMATMANAYAVIIDMFRNVTEISEDDFRREAINAASEVFGEETEGGDSPSDR